MDSFISRFPASTLCSSINGIFGYISANQSAAFMIDDIRIFIPVGTSRDTPVDCYARGTILFHEHSAMACYVQFAGRLELDCGFLRAVIFYSDF